MKPITEGLTKYKEIVFKIIFLLLIISIFLPIRHVFEAPANYATGAYSDFTSFSLYSCDLLIIALAFVVENKKSFINNLTKPLLLFICWLIIAFFINIRSEIGLNIYFFFKFIELIVLHETFKTHSTNYKGLISKIFIFMSVFESILAIYQFVEQKSLGLYRLGEQHIAPSILGIAKIGLNMIKFVRGYGTFPHPNLLSAFLLAGAVFSLSLLIAAQKARDRVIYSTCLTIIIFGLLVSFSRAALFSLVIVLIIYFIIYVKNKGLSRKVSLIILISFFSLLLGFIILKPFILARTDLATDESAKERIFYAKIGIKMIEDNPISGIGIGTSVLHMKQYSPVLLETWEIQPIHNYYLLSAAELGIVGALILIYLFFNYSIKLFLLSWSETGFSAYRLGLFCILLGFLILMLFDHYFYTIEQTQLLLWMILGLAAAEILEAKQKSAYEAP